MFHFTNFTLKVVFVIQNFNWAKSYYWVVLPTKSSPTVCLHKISPTSLGQVLDDFPWENQHLLRIRKTSHKLIINDRIAHKANHRGEANTVVNTTANIEAKLNSKSNVIFPTRSLSQ